MADAGVVSTALLGTFAIPATSFEAVWHLTNGNPIDLPRTYLPQILGCVDSWCSDADLDVRTEGSRAYVTPRKCTLNERGAHRLRVGAQESLVRPISNA